jgi:hypothetical protein
VWTLSKAKAARYFCLWREDAFLGTVVIRRSSRTLKANRFVDRGAEVALGRGQAGIWSQTARSMARPDAAPDCMYGDLHDGR